MHCFVLHIWPLNTQTLNHLFWYIWNLLLLFNSESEVTQLCPTLWDPMECSLPVSSIHGIFPGKNTGVGCHFLLQGISPTQGSNWGLLTFQIDALQSEPPGKFLLFNITLLVSIHVSVYICNYLILTVYRTPLPEHRSMYLPILWSLRIDWSVWFFVCFFLVITISVNTSFNVCLV